jgi:hypothetical protein
LRLRQRGIDLDIVSASAEHEPQEDLLCLTAIQRYRRARPDVVPFGERSEDRVPPGIGRDYRQYDAYTWRDRRGSGAMVNGVSTMVGMWLVY